MASLDFSEPILNPDNFVPYVEITYKTKLSFDFFEVLPLIETAGDTLENVMAAEYKQELEAMLPALLKKWRNKDASV